MSEVFEGYERQYCELSAALSKKCTSATLLDGDKKKPASFFSQFWFMKIYLQYALGSAARDELLESGMADAANVSADQKTRLLMSTERLNKTSDRVRDSRRTMLETEELGVSILQDLNQQRQSLLHAHGTLHGVDDNIGRSKKILTNMS
ncbi:vesicle transport v-SNARE 11-like, partial [Bidens hawaiensis]|uniref:vesicle transport v-SNARE 11-like n=1 Tax=Bidens hawaiensis TaxID=980011 RepID=UPI0040490C64